MEGGVEAGGSGRTGPFRPWAAALAIGAVAFALTPATGPTASPPDILLISIDTLRADRLHVYGNPRETSPAIDALAREGLLFEQATSHSPKTAPSHMSLFTGLLPPAHGVSNWEEVDVRRLGPRVPTLAALLRGAGYRTLAFTGGGNVRAELGFDEGFEVYESLAPPAAIFEAAGEALVRLSRSSGGGRAPFFLFVHTYAVHDPYLAPEPYASLWADPNYAGRVTASTEELVRMAGGRTDYWSVAEAFWSRVDPASADDVRHLLALYDACVRHADDLVGRLLSRLAQLGLAEGTAVVLLSDHGEEFREHGDFRHNDVYQEVLRVPLILRLPPKSVAAGRGRREAAPVGLADVMPTLLELAGLRPPAGIDGRSLLPLLRGRGRGRPVLSVWPAQRLLALREGRWKYVRRGLAEELYDLETDPGERRSTAAERLSRVEAMAAEALRQREDAERRLAARGAGSSVRPDEKTKEELRALGYVGF